MTAEDRPFVGSSWKRSYEQAAEGKVRRWLDSWEKRGGELRTPEDVWREHVLDHGKTVLICAEEDPEMVFGFACMLGETVEYVYVKDRWRGFGFARELLRHLGITEASKRVRYARRTKHVSSRDGTRSLPKGWVYVPFWPC